MLQYKITGLIFFLCCTIFLNAQAPATFSEQPEEFLKQLNEFVNFGKEAEIAKIYKDFETKFHGGFSDVEVKRIISTVNTMRVLHLHATPYFSDYLKCLVVVDPTVKDTSRFEQWNNITDTLLHSIQGDRFGPIQDFLAFSKDFLEHNTLLYGTNANIWAADNKNYKWNFVKGYPSIQWDKVTITAYYKTDSIRIKDTKGYFFPLQSQWKGDGGKVFWSRQGESETYVTLKKYLVDVSKGYYKADNVMLHYPLMFPSKDIEGAFEDKITLKKENEEPSYPRFESKERHLKIENLGGNVHIEAGFRLWGTTVYGYGTPEDKAEMTVNSEKTGNRIFRALAEQLIIHKGESVLADRTESTIYMDGDSLAHPSSNMKFDILKNNLSLVKGARGSDQNPFYDSYHRINFFQAVRLQWFINQDSLIIGYKNPNFGINNQNALFESDKYFSVDIFDRFQNIATYNPIANIKRYADQTGKRSFSANEIVKALDPKLDVPSIQGLLFDLGSQGFLNYDEDSKIVFLKDKIFHYTMSSNKKVDYDIIRFFSETNDNNAVMSLKDKLLHLTGVKFVDLSIKQKVRAVPTNTKLVVKQNRDFDFDGKLNAGMTVLLGKKFHFNYEMFELNMDSTRYFDLYLPTSIDKFKRIVASPIGSRIEHVKGTLSIDAPDNKSGREDIAIFPALQTRDFSYIFYDAPETQDSVYKRDSFYFRLDKFLLEGLDSLTRKKLAFKGTLYSWDIMSPFGETVVLQKDTSLGFITETNSDGNSLYKNKGNFAGKISLNNKGFFGDGTLKYLGAVVKSDDIVFKPKETLASSKNFDMKEDRTKNTPEVNSSNVQIHWKPYKDSLYVTVDTSVFNIFKEHNHTLKNTIVVTPEGVKGKGVFDWDKGTLQSKLFSFGAHSVEADTMNMSIRTLDKAIAGNQLAFDTKNIAGKIDFDKQKGHFKANSENLETAMPSVRYKTSMNQFEWDLQKESIVFDAGGKTAAFLCTDPDQDSLKFNGLTASYDLKTNVLNAGGVEYLRICDAFIYPDSMKITVPTGGKILPLTNARIVCDTATRYHVINRASVRIDGKKNYGAEGFYEYNIGTKMQEIKFDNIIGTRVGKGARGEKKTETRATGEVKDSANFYIDSKVLFKGKISLASNEPNLLLQGFAKLDLDRLTDKNWFDINFKGDKKNLNIVYKTPKNENGDPLATGVYISKENANAYPRIMTPLTFRKDRVVIDVRGVMKYDAQKDELLAGDSLKLAGAAKRGNRFVFSNKTGNVRADGKLGLCSGLTEGVRVVAAGRVQTHFLRPDEVQSDTLGGIAGVPVTIEAMTGIDLAIPDKLLKIMALDLQSGSFDAADIDYKKDDFYETALTEFIPEEKDYVTVSNDMRNRTLSIPDKYNKFDFLFSRIPMKWNSELQSFVSSANKAELNSITGIPLNKVEKALVEFKMPGNEDDRVYVYVRTSSDTYYFFGYQKGILSITSNNPRMEEEFNKIKPKERIKKISGDLSIEMQWVEPGTAETFARRIANAQH